MKVENSLKRAIAGTGASGDFSGSWKNELSSKMTIKQDGNKLTGSYESAVSADGKTTSGELVGFVDGKTISFLVHWNDFQAITSWVGQLDNSNTMHTLWQMVKTTDANETWASINAGADQFEKV